MFPRIRQTSYHYTVLCCCIFVTSAILSGRGSDFGISNVCTGVSGGGHAFYLEDGSSLLAASGTFFIGGFSSTYSSSADISTAFTTDFLSLAADFISIGSVGVEVDDIGPFDGLHNSVSTVDTSSVVGRYGIIITDPLSFDSEPNDAPGLGLEIDEAMLADYPAIPGPCYLPG